MADPKKTSPFKTREDKNHVVSQKEIEETIIDLLLLSDFGEELLKQISDEKNK
jgi:hypothetical protein